MVETLLGGDGIHFDSTGFSFTFMDAPSIQSIFPSVGPTSGGTYISIAGVHLVERMRCKFGSYATSDATFLSTSLVKCRTPQMALPLSMAVGLLYNANDASDNSQDFEYHPPTRILQFTPAFGHEAGGGPCDSVGLWLP